MSKVYSAAYLREFLNAVQEKSGIRQDIREVMTDSLLHSELRGISSHGLIRIEAYLKRVEAGVLDQNADPTVVRDEGATVLLDANGGFGQWASFRAMEIAIEKARQYGVGVVGVRNSNHYGEAAYYAEMASQAGMIGINVSSCSPAIAPYGAAEAVFGTNPIAMAVPTRAEPVTLDMATSVIAKGKLRLAALAGQEIPLGWARDANGHPTTDPSAALAGTLEAVGGPKGCGLTAMVDVLSGQLTDSVRAGEVKNITDVSGPAGNGQFFIVLNVSAFLPEERFLDNMDDFRRKYKSLTPVAGEVMLPGEIEYRKQIEGLKNGLSLKEGTVQALRRVGERYGVPFREEDAG